MRDEACATQRPEAIGRSSRRELGNLSMPNMNAVLLKLIGSDSSTLFKVGGTEPEPLTRSRAHMVADLDLQLFADFLLDRGSAADLSLPPSKSDSIPALGPACSEPMHFEVVL